MIPNAALINALRDLDFSFKRQADRVVIYKKAGSTARVNVRRVTLHDEDYCRILLGQAGMPPDEIELFITNYHCNQH